MAYMTPELMVELYEEGAITEYELYSRMREQGWEEHLPKEHQEAFKEWAAKHPKEGITFTIGA